MLTPSLCCAVTRSRASAITKRSQIPLLLPWPDAKLLPGFAAASFSEHQRSRGGSSRGFDPKILLVISALGSWRCCSTSQGIVEGDVSGLIPSKATHKLLCLLCVAITGKIQFIYLSITKSKSLPGLYFVFIFPEPALASFRYSMSSPGTPGAEMNR